MIVAFPEKAHRRQLYRFRLHRNNKIESTVNTQPFSFSTRPSTVNSQQSTVNNHLTVQPELILIVKFANSIDCYSNPDFKI
ncbi:MAG: hypothetical protein WBA89_07955 [Microcoleus sp.]|uniref:hypothetical protein n=1 Tax=Microcoleus sp. TaxID=44472 RepID=UPI003C7945F5